MLHSTSLFFPPFFPFLFLFPSDDSTFHSQKRRNITDLEFPPYKHSSIPPLIQAHDFAEMGKGSYLKNLCICLVGHLKHNHADVKKWVQAGGGIIHTTVGKDTTHLIVSPDQWKKKISPAVAQHDSKLESLHIVNYSWLEDSMRTFAKRSERQYLWQKLEEKQQKKDNLKLKEKAKAAKVTDKETERLQKAAKKDKERATKAATKVDYREALIDHLNTMSGPADKTRSSRELLAGSSLLSTYSRLCEN